MSRAYWIGIDEAGYGPNLGPLVIAATVWSSPRRDSAMSDEPPWSRVVRRVDDATSDDAPGWTVDDSKRIYAGGRGLAALETGVFIAWGLLGVRPAEASALWNAPCGAVAPPPPDATLEGFNPPLPLAACRDEIERGLAAAAQGCEQSGLRLERVAWRAIFPTEWNQLLVRWENKSTVLSRASLGLLAGVLEVLPRGADVLALSDQHGGRRRYVGLLTDLLGGGWRVVCEERGGSRYRRDLDRRVDLLFQPRGESFPPTALASMLAKYLRELSMRGFNEFWRRYVPDLQPTAGYPVDARRFFDAIEGARRSLGLADEVVWRSK